MTIEQKIFSRRRFSTKRLEAYGFVNKDACFSLSKECMDGDFTAEIRVYGNGSVQGRVMEMKRKPNTIRKKKNIIMYPVSPVSSNLSVIRLTVSKVNCRK